MRSNVSVLRKISPCAANTSVKSLKCYRAKEELVLHRKYERLSPQNQHHRAYHPLHHQTSHITSHVGNGASNVRLCLKGGAWYTEHNGNTFVTVSQILME